MGAARARAVAPCKARRRDSERRSIMGFLRFFQSRYAALAGSLVQPLCGVTCRWTTGAPRRYRTVIQFPGAVAMSVHALKTANVARLRDNVSPAEWETRVNLAACYRLIAHYGMSDLIANHISARVPGEHDAFLINAYGLLYEEITASSLLKIDHEGKILAKPDFGDLDYGVNRAGFVIHSAIHMGKPDVACVIHTHTWAGMAVSTMACGLLPHTQTSMRFAKIGYHDYDGVVIDTAAREALVKSL